MSVLPVSAETLTVFVAASVVLALTPGPDNIFVLTQSALHGRLAGLCVTIGLCTGLMAHTAAVAIGIAAVFATSAVAFTLLKIIGAAYLLTLALRAFRAGNTSMPLAVTDGISLRRLYGRGVIMNLTNPKVAIFFLAFLPQFAEPARGNLTLQLLFLGAFFILTTAAVFGLIAWSSGFLGKWLKRSHRAQVYLNRVAGCVFAALAVRLATAER
ncbi:MAG: LysE family translocator [Pseudomonadota bacterium]